MSTNLFEFIFESGGEHVGEELESDGEEQFHEGDDEEDGEGDEAQEILGRSLQLSVLPSRQFLPREQSPLNSGGDPNLLAE